MHSVVINKDGLFLDGKLLVENPARESAEIKINLCTEIKNRTK